MLRKMMVIVLACLLLAALVAGCQPVTAPAAPADSAATDEATEDATETEEANQEATAEATEEAAGEGAGLANPASVFCGENGGTLEIRDETGGQVGYCVFEGGSECEEWAYMRGECAPGEGAQGGSTADTTTGMANPASVFCADNGGTVEIRQGEDGGEYGMCVFNDGSECEEWAYFRGECAPGQPKSGANMPNPASANCIDQGGTLEIRQDAGGGEYGMCVFSDGSECEEWALLRGTCEAGQ
jgi:putative hemolysin